MKPKEVLLAWIDAFNHSDTEALSELYHEDAINHQVANMPVNGRVAIKKMFEDEFAATEMVCLPETIFEDGEWAIMEWKDPKGFRGCGFFHVVNSKIKLQRGYWDKLSFLKLYGPGRSS
jgi:limonene-1,2-epoxide hydrolase